MKVLQTLIGIAVLCVGVGAGVGIFRWLTAPTVSPEQIHTIDSLVAANKGLDSTITWLQESRDSVSRAGRARVKRDSTKYARNLDSLEALIPDSATMVPVEIHDAIVFNLQAHIVLFHSLWQEADSGWRAATDSLDRFRTQNRALLSQVNDLKGKANPGFFRRLGYAAPFIAATWGSCKLGLLDC